MTELNPFEDPILLQHLRQTRSAVILYIGSSAVERAGVEQELACPCVYVRSLSEALGSGVRRQLDRAQAQADDHSASVTASDRLVVTAVMQLESDTHSIDMQLGQAIRLFPDHLLVTCCDPSLSPSLTDEQFFAFGFRRLGAAPEPSNSSGRPCWYEYRMREYKSAPDWLNARYWANPERFDLSEDPDLYTDEEE
ncbi:MAG: hypothetical protein KTR32_07760 [Granulosicoccus sp.]|nr:hypothetical protein [Granulosicoccus sp.]